MGEGGTWQNGMDKSLSLWVFSIYIYGKLLGNKYKVEYIVIYEYVGQIGYGMRYHIIASF